MRIALLNGPNLNLLGRRNPSVYGRATLADVEQRVAVVAEELGATLECRQANGEGELIDVIHGWLDRVQGAVINAGAYSHGSLAIRDALEAVQVPFVEVHISNVHAREVERHHSVLARAAVGSVTGLGTFGYEAALRGLMAHLAATSQE